ncbi:MAG: T9SS type A sorting domain-containing protein [Bacteroidetes bacterium]|nr:T9SS type A sorting domain-containing protein [Bacteroidota bacterium]
MLKASGGSTYQWNNGILKDSNLVKPFASTTYTVTVSFNGCTDSSKVKVTVDTPAIVASISVLKDSICFGDPIQLNTTVSGGVNTYFYAWSSMPNGFSSIAKNPIDFPIGPIIYTVTITSGAKSISKSIPIKVIPKPNTPTITRTGNTLNSSNPSGNNWFKDTSKIANAINQSFSPTNNGNYFVQTTNFFGCQSNKSSVFVFALSAIPNVSKEEFEIYPNPFDGILNMRGSILDNNYHVEVLNQSGQVLYKSENSKTIDFSNYANGIYTVRILTSNQLEIKQQVVLSK